MAISKVQYKSSPSATPETWMDVTSDSVTAGTLLSGETATQNNGVRTTGTYTAPVTDVQVNGTSVVTNTVASVPAPTSIIDDTAGNGDTDKVWSADKVYDELYLKAYKVAGATNGNYAALNANGQPIDSGHKHSDYLNTTSDYQVINSENSYTSLVLASSTTGNTVSIRSDSEGGNVQVKKGSNLAEFDSQPLNDAGTGAARIFVKTGDADGINFYFKQNGNFQDGNGLTLGGLNYEKAQEHTVATVLKGSTSTKNVAKDEYVIWDGSLYRASAAIASGDTLSTSTNLTAKSNGIANILNKAIIIQEYSYTYGSIAANGYLTVTASNFGITAKSGYTLVGYLAFGTGSYNIFCYGLLVTASGNVMSLRNRSDATAGNNSTCRITALWVRNDIL